jgi:CPA2 family monovalent cation:H+ antiporter-2
VIISESDLSHQAAADALPMRDAFAVLFFVSVGMLFDPGVVDDSYGEILAILAVIVLGKAVVAFAIVAAIGQPARVGLTVAAGLAQIGEFSFILLTVGGDLEIVPAEQTDIVLATALISIMLNPLLYAPIDAIDEWLRDRAPALRGRGQTASFEMTESDQMRNHAVICGHGRVGRIVAQALEQRSFRYVVVESNRRTVQALRARGVPAIFGDAGHHLILGQASLETARVLVVTVPDPPVVRRIVSYARGVAPRLDIIARTHSVPELEVLTERGVGEAVYGEWEVALELTRRALYRFGLSSQEALAIVQRQRAQGPPRGLEEQA